jgi:hypothetical protein
MIPALGWLVTSVLEVPVPVLRFIAADHSTVLMSNILNGCYCIFSREIRAMQFCELVRQKSFEQLLPWAALEFCG